MAEEKPQATEAKKRKFPKGRHLSVMKRHRQSVKHAVQNLKLRSSTRTAIKKVLQAVEKKEIELAKTSLRIAVSLLHCAASKGIFHSGHASRHIGRLSSRVAHLEVPAK